MGLSDELDRPFPRIPHPALSRRKSALENAADQVAAIFGGVPRVFQPRPDDIARVEARLGPDGAGLASLARHDLKLVPYIIWDRDNAWHQDRAFIRCFLAAADRRWPRAARHLWRHYIVNFDSESPATTELASWLEHRAAQLPLSLQEFSDTFQIFDVIRAPGVMAQSMLRGGHSLDACDGLGLSLDSLRTSGLAVSVLDAAGRLLDDGMVAERVPERLTDLLSDQPHRAIEVSSCAARLKSRALRSLADGVVHWQERDSGVPEPVIDFLLMLNGDPRLEPDRWHGRVSDDAISTLEGWLSRKTIESFFRVIDALQTDNPMMWQARRAFWLRYLPFISKAWLVVGRHAIPIAEKEGLDFGRFVHGGGAQNDHCALMMQIRNLCVMEMNRNGTAMFWNAHDTGLPGFYRTEYSRHPFRDRVNKFSMVSQKGFAADRDLWNVAALAHQGRWQRRFADEILQRTGIEV
jgi:hypothetical protein